MQIVERVAGKHRSPALDHGVMHLEEPKLVLAPEIAAVQTMLWPAARILRRKSTSCHGELALVKTADRGERRVAAPHAGGGRGRFLGAHGAAEIVGIAGARPRRA